MTIFFSLLIALIGALVYGLSQNSKVAELGRIAFAFGLLVFLWHFNGSLTLLR
jgi:hypothetical protein